MSMLVTNAKGYAHSAVQPFSRYVGEDMEKGGWGEKCTFRIVIGMTLFTQPMYPLETYYYTDQQTRCPKCGARTDVVLDMSHTMRVVQVEECIRCGERFVFQKGFDNLLRK